MAYRSDRDRRVENLHRRFAPSASRNRTGCAAARAAVLESQSSQVRPLQRGGRRYYRPRTSTSCAASARCSSDGYTIKGAAPLRSGRLPQPQRLDLAAESALESLRIVSARAEAMTGGAARQPLPRTGPQPSTTTPRAAMLDLHKRREIETVLEDLEQALTQLRSTLKAQN
jgi:hypothetical protein